MLDLVVANAENSAGGFGVTREVGDAILKAGVDVMTSGNHVWDKKEVLDYITLEPRLLISVAAIVLSLLFAIAIGLWTSVLQARYRDVRYALRYVMPFWFLLTPLVLRLGRQFPLERFDWQGSLVAHAAASAAVPAVYLLACQTFVLHWLRPEASRLPTLAGVLDIREAFERVPAIVGMNQVERIAAGELLRQLDHVPGPSLEAPLAAFIEVAILVDELRFQVDLHDQVDAVDVEHRVTPVAIGEGNAEPDMVPSFASRRIGGEGDGLPLAGGVLPCPAWCVGLVERGVAPAVLPSGVERERRRSRLQRGAGQ